MPTISVRETVREMLFQAACAMPFEDELDKAMAIVEHLRNTAAVEALRTLKDRIVEHKFTVAGIEVYIDAAIRKRT